MEPNLNLICGIDHVQVAAPPGCEQEARRFYGGVVGLREIPKPEALQARGGCWFQCGTQQLHIGVAQDFKPSRKAHPAFQTPDLAALERVLASQGIGYERDGSIPGTRRIYAHDPWGNRLEFVQI